MKQCAFCEIANHLKPASIIYEDEIVIIFLDKRPLFHGHSLLAPKIHYETLQDLPTELIQPFFTKMQELAIVVKDAMQAQGTFIAMNNTVSQSVPHMHVHVVPRVKGDGLKGFFWPRNPYQNNEEMIALNRLKKTWRELFG
jgi:histidine triad (HIT) family protein